MFIGCASVVSLGVVVVMFDIFDTVNETVSLPRTLQLSVR